MVVSPDNFVLLDRPENLTRSFSGDLSNIQAFVPFAVGGIGASIPLWRNLALSIESFYSYPLGNLIDTGVWRISQLSLSAGVRVRL